MNFEYSELDGYVSAKIEGTSKEVADFVLAIQERRLVSSSSTIQIQKEDINHLAKVLQKSTDGKGQESPEK